MPAAISTGNGSRRGVQNVLNEPSIQFRWSSVSNTSPSNRSSAQTPGDTSCDSPISSRNGFCGATSRGNSASRVVPSAWVRRQRAPAHSRIGMEDAEADPVPQERRARLAVHREPQRSVGVALDRGPPDEIDRAFHMLGQHSG